MRPSEQDPRCSPSRSCPSLPLCLHGQQSSDPIERRGGRASRAHSRHHLPGQPDPAKATRPHAADAKQLGETEARSHHIEWAVPWLGKGFAGAVLPVRRRLLNLREGRRPIRIEDDVGKEPRKPGKRLICEEGAVSGSTGERVDGNGGPDFEVRIDDGAVERLVDHGDTLPERVPSLKAAVYGLNATRFLTGSRSQPRSIPAAGTSK